MGCTASKLENDDMVRRCKERHRLMKDAVYARHHLAAAHADYCRSLRVTGSTLSAFAAGEPLSVSEETPAVLLRTSSSVSRSTTFPASAPRVPPSPSVHHPPPPPPPPPDFSPSPSPTIASSKLPHILSASCKSSSRRHRKPPIKLPHILSESSVCSSPRSHTRARSDNFAPNFTYNVNSNYSSSPSQASSIWNWENFYPPSPPGSEFFERRKNDDEKSSNCSNHQKYQNLHPDNDDKASTYSRYSNYQAHHQKQHNKHNHHLEADEEETVREEVHYSEWVDHYNTTSSSEDEDDEDGDSRSEAGA